MSDAIQAMAIERAAIDGDNFFDYTDEQRQIVLDDERHILQVLVREAVGCPQCGGTNIPTMHPETTFVDGKRYGIVDCPAEHVELSILGTIWADPTKCEWRCYVDPSLRCEHLAVRIRPELFERFDGIEDHSRCGWQPRMDALFGEAE